MEKDDKENYKVLSVLYEHELRGKKLLICKEESTKDRLKELNFEILTLVQLKRMFPKTPSEKMDRILLNLFRRNSSIGTFFNKYDFDHRKHYSINETETGFLLELMGNRGLISHGIISWSSYGEPTYRLPFRIEEGGWDRIDNLTRSENSRNAFVAMWFDEKMASAFTAIEKAIRKFDFIPVRIDQKEHNNEISGEILYDIKQSRFMIADVTGQRQGVYFEAGYAIGLGIPVIWCCKSNELEKVHFDTRQYNHIVWNHAEDLEKSLSNRIKGTILTN